MTTNTLPKTPTPRALDTARRALWALATAALASALGLAGARLTAAFAPGFVAPALEVTTMGDLPLRLSFPAAEVAGSCGASGFEAVTASGATDLTLAFRGHLPLGGTELAPGGPALTLDLRTAGTDLGRFTAESGLVTRNDSGLTLAGRFSDDRGRDLFVAARHLC